MNGIAGLTLLTSNQDKAREYTALLRVPMAVSKPCHPEIQALDPAVVAQDKAARAYARLGKPVMVDDTGLGLTAWNGYPGALISWVMKSVGPDGLISMAFNLSDRRAVMTTAIGYADQHGARSFTGTVEGLLANAPAGDYGFDFDCVFIPGSDPGGRTRAEMMDATRREHSPLRLAVKAMLAELGAPTAPA